ncbi:MAG: hypothetical protein AB8H79_25955 [Myxococcota bacterium]
MGGVRQFVWLGMLGCLPTVYEPPEPPVPGAMGLVPSIAGQGVTLEFTLTSQTPVFADGNTTLSFGQGVEVQDLRVEDPQTVVSQVWVDDTAELGFRDVSVAVAGWDRTLQDAVLITAESLSVTPASARPGQVIDVVLRGKSTSWNETSWAHFGEGTRVLSMDQVQSNFAVATVAVEPSATLGLRDVSVDDITLYGGFDINREGVVAEFDPQEVPQGAIVDFTISADGIEWSEDLDLEIWDDGARNEHVLVRKPPFVKSNIVYGQVQASNAAGLGTRDVVIRNGGQRLYITDAFEVTETVPNLKSVVLTVSWDVHSEANSRGEVVADGQAIATFFLPLNPPCDTAPPPTPAAGGFDLVELQPDFDTGDRPGCPTAKTFDAGPEVWLKGDESVVRLTREIVSGKGYTRYVSSDTAPEDYPFNQTFDLITDGAGQIPQMTLPGILQTVPADVVLLNDTDLWHSRFVPLTVRWRPALSYPNAEFLLTLKGRLLKTGQEATLTGRPWDDGEFDVPTTALTQFDVGPAEVRLLSTVEGPEFSLPFTNARQPRADSTVSMSQQVDLE